MRETPVYFFFFFLRKEGGVVSSCYKTSYIFVKRNIDIYIYEYIFLAPQAVMPKNGQLIIHSSVNRFPLTSVIKKKNL